MFLANRCFIDNRSHTLNFNSTIFLIANKFNRYINFKYKSKVRVYVPFCKHFAFDKVVQMTFCLLCAACRRLHCVTPACI